MRAGGGRTPAGFSFNKDKTRLQLFTGSNSQSPHPSLLPEGEGGIPASPSALVARRGSINGQNPINFAGGQPCEIRAYSTPAITVRFPTTTRRIVEVRRLLMSRAVSRFAALAFCGGSAS